MAALATLTMGKLNEDRKPLHPLFQRTTKPAKQILNDDSQPPRQSAVETLPLRNQDTTPSEDQITVSSPASKQSESPVFTPSSEKPSNHTSPLEVDPNDARRKRRKTASPAADDRKEVLGVNPSAEQPRRSGRDAGHRKPYSFAPDIGISPEIGLSSQGSDAGPVDVRTPSKRGRPKGGKPSPLTLAESNSLEISGNDTSSTQTAVGIPNIPKAQVDDKPKKFLKFNPRTGTIGSPPTKKSTVLIEKPGKRKSKKCCIVTIRYGRTSQLPLGLGERIEQILNNPPRPKQSPKKKSIVKDVTTKIEKQRSKSVDPVHPPKPVHPLFLGKAAAQPKLEYPEKSAPKTNIVNLVTPKHELRARSKSPNPRNVVPFAGFGARPKAPKTLGSSHPAWPWKGTVHVRGVDDGGVSEQSGIIRHTTKLSGNELSARKEKYQVTHVAVTEDILHAIAVDMDVKEVLKEVKEVSLDDWTLPPKSLRIPSKHLESGVYIQQRIQMELHPSIRAQFSYDTSNDELHPVQAYRIAPHPALSKVYNDIGTSLSAFDKGQCEVQAWAHKYAPLSATEVLQIGQEAIILKDWLQKLTVKSVESGIVSGMSSSQKFDVGKRKRKGKRTNDFIVSDDESDDLDELTEPDDEDLLQRDSLNKKTVVRTVGRDSRLKNAVLISGPHGCGKTATVHAVAKELGFEIFEINSSSRRSGKDIMEKVGDMTRNHLVQRHQNLLPQQPMDEDKQRIEQALADDIQSGRQGTMNSFFKPKDLAKSKPKPKQPATTQCPAPRKDVAPKKDVLKDVPLVKSSQKEQKQSLILIEEIDILYEEDKQFWNTVLNLILTSKRPIIMTCSDETSGPGDLDNFLHAIIRLSPPPTDLATDYMLLVAACEGHILQREAVKELYEGRNQDLRGAMNELNFWCQFAVGDQKHGGDWYYRRLPGHDLDNDGNQIRVVSEGTYSSGLSWVSEDVLTSGLQPLDVEERLLRELWDGRDLDIGDWHSSLPLDGWAHAASSGNSVSRLAALESYQSFVECMSVSDLCSGPTFSSDSQSQFDTTHPPLPTKVYDDFTLGRTPIFTPSVIQHHPLAKDVAIYLRSRARNILHTNKSTPPLPPQSEGQLRALIRMNAMSMSSNDAVELSRRDLSLAFDPISYTPSPAGFLTIGSGPSTSTLEPSIFDRTVSIITADVAPYVRGITAYETCLQRQRAERSGLLMSSGNGTGRGNKKVRMTRSSLSALEGGTRSTTRRDKWFDAPLNAAWVAKTGGVSWEAAADQEVARRRVLAIQAIQAAMSERQVDNAVDSGGVASDEVGNQQSVVNGVVAAEIHPQVQHQL